MVLYKLKGIKKEGVYEILDGIGNEYNCVVHKRNEKYYIHDQFDDDRYYSGQVEVIEVGEILLCELTFEDEYWWRNKYRRNRNYLIFSILSSILSAIFFILNQTEHDYQYIVVATIASVVTTILILLFIYLNARNPYLCTVAKRQVMLAFEDWFTDYI